MAASARMDLHCHSTSSDGRLSPTALVQRAAARGLDLLAITDHDTLEGVPEALDAAASLPLTIVPGAELSTHHRGRGVHLLAFWRQLPRADGPVRVKLQERVAGRVLRVRRIAEALAQAGVPLDVEAILAGGGAVTRAHVARQLVRQGCVSQPQEAFDRWLGRGKRAFVPNDRWTTADAIRFVREHGGVTSIAHPGVDDVTREEVAELQRAGLHGVEVRHPAHGRQARRRLGRWVRELGLLATGGSDWHGLPGGDLLGATIGDGLPVAFRPPFEDALGAWASPAEAGPRRQAFAGTRG
jgi:predicted metal-dependent phosphoesterase TrpH